MPNLSFRMVGSLNGLAVTKQIRSWSVDVILLTAGQIPYLANLHEK